MSGEFSILRIPEGKPKAPSAPRPAPPVNPQRQFLRFPALVVTIIALNTVAFAVETLAGGSTNTGTLVMGGALYGPLVREGQVWRLLTAAFLHIGILHLLVNMWSLWALGRYLEPLYGTFRFGLIYVFSASTASALSAGVHTIISAGASGAIFGVVGAMVVVGYRYRQLIPVRLNKAFGQGALPFILYNLVYGFGKPGIDNWAHVGGLAGGALLAVLLRPLVQQGWAKTDSGVTAGALRPLAQPGGERRWVKVLSVAGFVALVFSAFLANIVGVAVYGYRMAKVEEMLNQDKTDDAKTALERAGRGYPPNALYNTLNGRVLYAQGKLEDAIKQFREAIETNPDYVDAHLNLSQLLSEKGDAKGSLEELRQAAKLSPDRFLAPTLSFEGHTKRVTTLVFSPDSRLLASGALDGRVKVWGIPSGQLLSTTSHAGDGSPVEFSPDGLSLAAIFSEIGTKKQSLGLWSVYAGKPISHRPPLPNVSAIAFSSDWHRLPAYSDRGRIQLWDVTRGKIVRILDNGETPFLSVARFSPDGRLFATPANNNVAKVWDVENGRELYSIPGQPEASEEGIVAVFFSRDGSTLTVVDSHKNLKVCDTKNGAVLKTTPVDMGGINIVEYVALSPDGRWLAAETVGGAVLLTDLERTEPLTLPGHRHGATAVAVSPDGQWVATGSWAGEVKLWKIPTRPANN